LRRSSRIAARRRSMCGAKIILATADGCGPAEIMCRSGKLKPIVWRWQARFMTEGVDGLTRDKTRKPGLRPPPCSGSSIWRWDHRRGMQHTGPAGCARPHPAGAADEAGPRWNDDARLQTPWHNHAVRSSQHPRWHGHRPQRSVIATRSSSASLIRSKRKSR
jgi:hypothetical protein